MQSRLSDKPSDDHNNYNDAIEKWAMEYNQVREDQAAQRDKRGRSTHNSLERQKSATPDKLMQGINRKDSMHRIKYY